MTLYARRGDAARATRRDSEALRRQRTGRPRIGHVYTLNFVWAGEMPSNPTDMLIPPALITIDPSGEGDYREFKQIIGFDAWLRGEVTLKWMHNLGDIHTGHAISGGSGNRVMLDEPYIIENTIFLGQFIQPEVTAIADTGGEMTAICLIETVPT
jgi:hypothetical protein